MVSSVLVTDFISDHCAAIACTRDHPSQRKITYRCLKNINFDELSKDFSNIGFKMEYIDVNLVFDNYNTVLSSLLDSYAPLKTDYVTSRILRLYGCTEAVNLHMSSTDGRKCLDLNNILVVDEIPMGENDLSYVSKYPHLKDLSISEATQVDILIGQDNSANSCIVTLGHSTWPY